MIIFWIFTLLVSLSAFFFGYLFLGLGAGWALIYALIAVLVLRGLFSWIRRSLVLRERIADYDDQSQRTLETNRYIFWRRVFFFAALLITYLIGASAISGLGPGEALTVLPRLIFQALGLVLQLGALFLANFALFFGPFILFGKMGRETLEPGDANYDVKIEDVRGQRSAVSEMMRILRLIESGRNYVKAGGKRERGVLMVGPPGTGKTMLAKGIASTLHTPIIITSGASFSGMFMGMDMVSVWMMIRAAKKKAKRWGGCTIFIDEFDALGQRRSGMNGGGGGMMGGMMGGGQLGLNMLLVQMDGADSPGFVKKFLRRTVNVTLDGLFIPRTWGRGSGARSLRVPALSPPRYNLFFIGATNRPSVLDEAVTRPGRFGRTITFRMPTREDRRDIADLYFAKKAHDPDLDGIDKRDEFARVTNGYSPAMIEQALSLALMYAFEDGRQLFAWKDLREAMGNIESGLVQPIEYTDRDKLAVARHELGHAVATRFFQPDQAHVRLSIRMRSDGSLGHHRSTQEQEEFIRFRSQLAADVRSMLGAIASERVFYGENSNGVYADLMMATAEACHMVGLVGMGADLLPLEMSKKAVNIGENLLSTAEMGGGLLEGGSRVTSVLQNPHSRRVVAQILGAAYIDDWRLMYANREAIDRATEVLILHGELVGDEIKDLLDSVALRPVLDSDPYPDDFPTVPLSLSEELRQSAGERNGSRTKAPSAAARTGGAQVG